MAKCNEEQLAKAMGWHEERQATLTDDQKAENKTKFAALMGDPEKMTAAKAEGDETFKASDTNGDGTLTLAEFKDFAQKSYANAQAKGWHVPAYDEGEAEKWWTFMCEVAGTPAGISKGDHDSIQGQMMMAVAAKMQQ